MSSRGAFSGLSGRLRESRQRVLSRAAGRNESRLAWSARFLAALLRESLRKSVIRVAQTRRLLPCLRELFAQTAHGTACAPPGVISAEAGIQERDPRVRWGDGAQLLIGGPQGHAKPGMTRLSPVCQRRGVRRTAVLAAISAAVALGLADCSSKPTATPQPVASVSVAAATRKTIQRVIHATALLYPLDQRTIVPKISAPILKFYVQRGSHVHKGELLAVLENKDLSAAVVENQGAYQQAQATYATSTKVTLPELIQAAKLNVTATRQAMEADQAVYQSRLKLYKAGAIARNLMNQSKVAYIQTRNMYEIAATKLKSLESIGKSQQLKAAQGQLNTAKGKYLAAQAQYDYSHIVSTMDGVVASRPLFEGQMASAGSPLMIIMNTSHMVARAHIPLEQAAFLHVGDAATILTATGDKVPGKITVVSPAVDPGSTTVQVWVDAANPGGRLKAGATVTVSMVAETLPNVLVIPSEALLTAADGTTSVMTVGPDRIAHQVSVKTGVRQDDEVEITSGLQPGDLVVTAGAYGLADGTKVKF